MRLSHLLDRLVELPGEFRIRLSSIEATEVTRELVAVMARHPERLCPHLHIALQSGSDEVLRRMRRRWGRQRFIDRCRLVQESLDLPAITTDVIAGFPGETEGDFQQTLDLAQTVGFAKIHAFRYSPRRGTAAADFADQVAADVRNERMARLAAFDQQLQAQYQDRLVGRRLDVLVESPVAERPGWMSGTACRHVEVELPAELDRRRQLVPVIACAGSAGRLVGEPITGATGETSQRASAIAV
jgi:threonylcarbamoyladenosine tRNA methylthiotransferase MtaB